MPGLRPGNTDVAAINGKRKELQRMWSIETPALALDSTDRHVLPCLLRRASLPFQEPGFE